MVTQKLLGISRRNLYHVITSLRRSQKHRNIQCWLFIVLNTCRVGGGKLSLKVISAPRPPSKEISTATPLFSESNFSVVCLPLPLDIRVYRKFKMAALIRGISSIYSVSRYLKNYSQKLVYVWSYSCRRRPGDSFVKQCKSRWR